MKNREKVAIEEFMEGKNVRIYKGYKQTLGDKSSEKRVFSNYMRLAMTTETPVVVNEETGETVSIPIGLQLIKEKIDYWRENPKDMDLKVISAVLGESKTEVDAKVTSADELFDITTPKKGENEPSE